jgi:protein phosphatase
MTGKNNEDRFAVSAYRLNQRSRTPILLAVLCDGIGGHKAGEIAAELAVNHISQVVADSNGSNPQQIIQEGIEKANQAIYLESVQDNGKQGMGSTVACVWLFGKRLFTATVGDSRIYLIRGDRIRQLSTDHTWIQEALDNGLLTADQVEGHPNRHVIRRYLGGVQPPEVDFRIRMINGENDHQALQNQGVILKPGDRLLLCSDGLTDLVSDGEIQSAFDEQTSEAAVEGLIDLANQRGGHDNITIVTIKIPQDVKSQPKKRSVIPLGCAIGAILLGLIVIATSAYFLSKGSLPWLAEKQTTTLPAVITLNPMITSAPQASSTPAPATVTATTAPAFTATTISLATAFPENNGYPAPTLASLSNSSATSYP